MYQRLDGFHPIFTKSYLDEEKWRFGARYASSSALDYGGRVLEPRKLDSCTFFFKNLASLQSTQKLGGAVPHFLGAFLMRVRGRVHGRIMRASRTRLTIFNYTHFRETQK